MTHKFAGCQFCGYDQARNKQKERPVGKKKCWLFQGIKLKGVTRRVCLPSQRSRNERIIDYQIYKVNRFDIFFLSSAAARFGSQSGQDLDMGARGAGRYRTGRAEDEPAARLSYGQPAPNVGLDPLAGPG